MKILRLILVVLGVVGCNDRSSDPPTLYTPAGPTILDLGFVDGGVVDSPVPSLCAPGNRRCLAENSPLYEVCRPGGETFETDSCDDGEVCRGGQCVPFSCTPGRPICLGTTTRSVCDATGRAFTELIPCDADLVCQGGSCIDLCERARESGSYIGCDYVARRLPNEFENFQRAESESPWGIVVANPERMLDARVSVRDSSGAETPLRNDIKLTPSLSQLGKTTRVDSAVLKPDGTSTTIESSLDVVLPPRSAAVFLLPRGEETFQIESTRPVVASQFSPYCCAFTATNDASLLLPNYTWGERYRVVGYPTMYFDQVDQEGRPPYVDIVAGDAETHVTVESPVAVAGPHGVAETAEFTLAANSSARLTVIQGERTTPDLSGMEISTDQPVAVFTGHPCTFVPQDKWACDHLEEQVPPADILGSQYVLIPTRRRADLRADVDEGTYWRIVADRDAIITPSIPLDDAGPLPPSNPFTQDCRALLSDGTFRLNAGEVCEVGTRLPLALSSTAPIIVAGVISGHESTGVRVYGTQAGDPSLFILPPYEQWRKDYSFVSPPTYQRSYVSIAATPGASISLDDQSITESARLERRQVTLGAQTWEVFSVAVESGVHRLEGEMTFGLVVYAYDDYVSYAFTGGLDLVPKGAAPAP